MKILILFDVARPADPNETFSARSLKEEDKPTEADVLRCLKRLGHDVETLAVFDNVTDIVEKLRRTRRILSSIYRSRFTRTARTNRIFRRCWS